MSLLDRFRGQPEWRHEDPSVRASAVDDLDDDAQDLLVAIASEDADPGVRLAAVSRLSDPESLVRIARSDQDMGVRVEASAILREMAVSDADPERAAVGLSGLTDSRDLGEVARTAGLEAISRLALDRLESQNQKTIGAVARRSVHRAVRRAALARLQDTDQLLAVAVRSDHKDTALAAFERLAPNGHGDRALLKVIARRARAKPVVRRAKAALTALDAQPTPASPDEEGQRLCESVEALTSADDWDLVTGGLVEAERNWRALEEILPPLVSQDGTPDGAAQDEQLELDTAVADRWIVAVARAREHLVRLDLARSEASRLRQARSEALAIRAELCERLAALVADESRDGEARIADVEAVRAEWLGLPELPSAPAGAGDDGASVGDRHFEELVARAERQVRQWRSVVDRAARLAELAGMLEAISETEKVDDGVARWASPHAEWTDLVQGSAPGEAAELTARVEIAEARWAERLAAAREERRRREQANFAKQQKRCAELEQALVDQNLELSGAERRLRLTRSLLGNLGRLPTRQDRDSLTKRLRELQTALTGRVRELRGLVEWKQWANSGVQVALCQRLEALATADDDAVVAKEFRQVMAAWRQASDVPRGEGEELWQRFKTAHDAIRPRAEAHLAKQDVDRGENLARKAALCEEAERLADSTDWVKTAQRIAELQAQWKQVGLATRRQEREAWTRFRAACGRFFRRRREDLVQRKQVWTANAKLKEALCERAEALAEESDVKITRVTANQLQAEWKTVGSVRRTRSEGLWQRFRLACDLVYTRAQHASNTEFADRITARAAVCERLEALVPETGDTGAGPPESLAETVAAARTEWRQLPPVPRPQERSLTARFQAGLARVLERYPAAFSGSDLDPQRNRGALERLCERVEALLENTSLPSAGGRSPAEILAAQLREALASNTMGAGVDLEAKQRADTETVKRAQVEYRAVGLVPGKVGRELSDRFRAACDLFFRQSPPPPAAGAPGSDGDGARRRGRPGPRRESSSRGQA